MASEKAKSCGKSSGSSRRAAGALVCAAALGMSFSVQAANVLIVGAAVTGIDTYLAARQTLAGNSPTIITQLAALPANLTSFSQIWDLGANVALNNAVAYTAYAQAGGALFLMGENSGYGATRNANLVTYLTGLGAGAVTVGAGNSPNAQTINTPFLTANQTSAVTFAAIGQYATVGTGTCVTDFCGAAAWGVGTLANAALGSVVSVLDVNFMQPTYAQPLLVDNLIGYLTQQAVIAANGGAAPAASNINTTVASYLTSGLGGAVNPAFEGGTLQVDTAGANITQNFTIDDSLNGATSTIDQNGNASTFSGIISNATGQTGSLTIANGVAGGAGSVTLTGANTYTGATTVNAGATLVLSGAVDISGSSGVANNGTFDISGTTAGASITALSGTGGTTLGAQTLTLTNAAGTYDGVLSGTGGLTVAGGTETLSGINTYTGASTVNTGATLALAGTGSIAASSGVVDNGTFDIAGTTAGATITTLSGAGATTLGAQTLTLSAAAGTYAGAASGTGGLTVAGGAETLSGINTYTGATTINSGATLALSGTGSIAASSGVADNGTFDISGTTTGAAINTLTGNGSIVLGAQTLTLNTASSFFTGSISSTGGGLTIVGGTFVQNSPLSNLSALNIGSAAIFSSAGSIGAASVNNAGVFTVADGTITTITGNYTQSATGVFLTNLSSAASYGKLAVTGNVDLSAGNNIAVNVLGAPTLIPGSVLPGVISATGTMTAGPSFNVVDNSALFNFIGVKNGQAVDLYITSANITALGSVNSVQTTATSGGAASVLDSFIAAGAGMPAAMAPVITALGMLPTQQAVSDAVSQTLPLLTAGMAQVTSGTTHNTNRIVQARMDTNRGLSSGDEFLGNKNFWLKPFYSKADQNMSNGVAGYSSNTAGAVLGADSELSSHERIGVALAYSVSNVKGKSLVSNTGNVNSTQAIFYGSHALADSAELNYQADVGIHQNKGVRQISFGGLNSIASSAYNSTSMHVAVGYGRTINISETAIFSPDVRIDYSSMRDGGYTETGAGGLSLAVQGRKTDSMVLSLGGKGAKKWSDHTTLSGHLGVGYDALSRQSSLTSSYVGGGAAFTTNGMSPSPVTVNTGVGLAYAANNGSELLLRYDLEARSKFTNQTVSAKWRMPF